MCILCGKFGLGALHQDGDSTSPMLSDAPAAEIGPIDSLPPAFSLGQIVNQLRTQWGGTGQYAEGTYRVWFNNPITYSINDGDTNGTRSTEVLTGMTAAMINLAQFSFAVWDDLIPWTLTENNSSAANITFNYASTTQGGGTYAAPIVGATPSQGYYPIQAQGIFLNSTWTSHDQDSDLFFGGYGITTYVHEIGHTLGLSHPGSYNAGSGGTITYLNNAEFLQDNRQYSLMSYFGGYDPVNKVWTQDGGGTYYPSTPMVFDIAAIQATYGADTATRNGNSTYGYNVTADVAARATNGLSVYNFAQNAHPIFTIWDGGGSDTLDCSGYAGYQLINLQPGSYSNVVGMNGNVAIAFGCIIEAAKGGAGNDVIYGNDAGNYLYGNGGANTMFGGNGSDFLNSNSHFNVAFGEEGSDLLYFAGNQNTLYGGNGNDWLGVDGNNNALVGGEGDEVWMGASGNGNTLNGEGGQDSLYVNGGANYLTGGNANDWVGCSGNSNTLIGGAGSEWMGATGGGNALAGGDANDTLFSVGSNILYGENGNDWVGCSGNANWLFGGAGDDYVAATGNNNYLDGGPGNDQLVAGGAHSGDRFIFRPGYGIDTITSFSRHSAGGTDLIDMQGFGLSFATLLNYAGDQNGNVVIVLNAATVLVINGTTKASLQASDFVF